VYPDTFGDVLGSQETVTDIHRALLHEASRAVTPVGATTVAVETVVVGSARILLKLANAGAFVPTTTAAATATRARMRRIPVTAGSFR
jgi:hypothetical protein